MKTPKSEVESILAGKNVDAHKELKTITHETNKRQLIQNTKVTHGTNQSKAKYSISFVYSLDASMIFIVGFVYSCCGAKVRGFLWRRKLALHHGFGSRSCHSNSSVF